VPHANGLSDGLISLRSLSPELAHPYTRYELRRRATGGREAHAEALEVPVRSVHGIGPTDYSDSELGDLLGSMCSAS
jgi:hypothetical protein